VNINTERNLYVLKIGKIRFKKRISYSLDAIGFWKILEFFLGLLQIETSFKFLRNCRLNYEQRKKSSPTECGVSKMCDRETSKNKEA
jgi:hypothetical protein